ncbi:glutathione S- transferase, nitrogen catabolite repression regulator [Pseudogymnoascus verrucosus]|uniref:Glutathione S-transferase, nitrogen catabolite repression regulator n=1 Tax=Pseudogymnoascus verrucosus TaxID=342668 RepID=A0A1B8GP22_9PEZI|nr:glutathione S- transferase, nitrogen catabolite repression regulator [Pseudogymnoascus verrucosus]OBT97551.1 glutathione S- transferase, nitrogen catabolite repression regulator [Pseudogymnoascus verrucosus]
MKPIVLYSRLNEEITLISHTAFGPNPWKVAIVLEELKLPYKTHILKSDELKLPEYERISPNGKVPAIEDPNTGVSLWESCAIIEYLVDTYDEASTISYSTLPGKYHIKQFLYFQASGQGPYFGQAF